MSLLPIQSPLAVQGAFEVHVIVALSPRVIESGSTEMLRLAGGLEPPAAAIAAPAATREKTGAKTHDQVRKREMKDSHSASVEEIFWQGSTIG